MAGKQLDVDKIQLEVTVDGSPARKELAETRQEVAKLKTEQQKLAKQESDLVVQRNAQRGKDPVEYRRLSDELAKVRNESLKTELAIDAQKAKAYELQKSLGDAGLSANELRGYMGRLKSELAAGIFTGTPEEIAKVKQIEEVEARYKALNTTVGRARVVWESERKAIDLNRMSIRQLGLELDRWEDIKDRSDPNSAEWAEADAAIKRVKDRTAELTDTQKRAEAQWDKDRHSISLTAASVEQLGLEEKRLQAILANPNTNAADRRKAAEDLRVVQDRTEQLTNANRIAQDVWEQQRKEMKLVEMSVQQLGLEEQRLKAIINAPTTSDADRQQAARHLEAVIQRTKELTDLNQIAAKAWEEERKSIDLVDMSLEQLGKETARYKEIQRSAQPNSAQYAEATAGLAAVKDRTEQLTNASRMAADEWVKMRGKLTLDQMSIQQLKLEKQYLDDLRGSLQRTDPALDKIEQDFIAVEKALKGSTDAAALQERQWERMRGSLKLTDMSIEDLEQEVKFLNAAIARMKPGDTGLDKLRRDAQAAEGQLAKLKTGLGPFGQMWASIKTQMLGAGAVIGTLFAGGAIMQGIRSLISSSAKVSDEFAEIQKVTGKTADEVKRLNTEISRIDTRTASTDLRGIAVGLGQAGQEVTGVAIAAIDKINLALGSEFGASAKEITNTVSVLRNNLSDVKSGNYAEDVGKIGNAILVLGQSGLATAPVVSDIGNRIAGVARQFDVSSGQILGTAAAFQELGISTERGSTAYTKLLQKISVNPQAFADVVKKAGGNVEEFNRLVNTDMQAAFLMVAKSAKDAGSENTEFGAILKELETSGAGVSELLSKVGANTELFAQKANIATEALKNQNAINAQAKLANETLAAQLEKLGKEFNRVFTSTTVINGIKSVVAGLIDLVKWVKESTGVITFWGGVLLKGVSVWAAYRIGAVAATAATRLFGTGTVNTARLMAILRGEISLTTRASVLLANAWRANPVGLIISALTAGYAIFSTFRDVVDSVTVSIEDLGEADKTAFQKAQSLYYQIGLANKGTTERRDLVNELKNLYPGYLEMLDADKASNEEIAVAMEGLNAQLINKIILEKQDAKIREQAEDIADKAILRAEAEAEARKLATDLAHEYGMELKANGTLEEKLLDLRQRIHDADNGTVTDQQRISGALHDLQVTAAELNGENRIGADLDKARSEILKTLGRDFRQAADQAKELYSAPFDYVPFAAPNAPQRNPLFTGKDPEQQRMEDHKKTLAEINQEIQRLQEQQSTANNAATYAELQKQVDHYEKLKASITGVSKATKKGTNDIDKHIEELAKLTQHAQEEAYQSGLSADEKELAQLRAKQREELKAAQEHADALVAAGRMSAAERTALLKKLDDEQATAEANMLEQQAGVREQAELAEQGRLLKLHNDTGQKIENADRESYKQRLQDELAYWDEAIALAEKKGENTVPLQRNRGVVAQKLELFDAEDAALAATKFWDDLKAQAEQANREQVAIGLKGSFDIAAIEAQKARVIEGIKAKSAKKQKDIARELNESERALQIKRLQDFATVAQGLGSITSAIQQNAEQAADADGERTKAEQARIRRIALLNIAIQTATAIANGVASAMSVPFPGNLAAAATTIATVIGLMGQASALMGSAGSEGQEAQNNPNWSDNNLTLTGEKGIPALDGSSHAQGGLDVVDVATGKRVANIEGGEAVVNKEVTAENPEVIDALMDAAHRTDKKVQLPPDAGTRSEEGHVVRGTALVNAAAPGTAGGDGTKRIAYGGLFGMEEDKPATGQRPTHGTALVNAAAPHEEDGTGQDKHGKRMASGGVLGMEEPPHATGQNPTRGTALVNAAAPDKEDGTDQDKHGKRMASGGVLGMEDRPQVTGQHPTRGTALVNAAGPNTQDREHLTDLPQLKLEDGGIFKGSLHRDGGNTVIDNRTGQAIAEVEKDEPWMVLSRAFREKNSALIPTLLEASRRGLRLDHISTAPIPVPNPQRVAQAMRIAHYADGGLFGMGIPSKKQKNPGLAAEDDGTVNGMLDALTSLLHVQQRMLDQNDQMIRRMGEVNEGVRNFPTRIKAYTVLNKEHDRAVKQWEAMKTRYSARA